MTRTSQLALAATVALGAFLFNDNMSLTQPSSVVAQAEARIGRPGTPMSVAGVARRQNRRAVYGGGVYGGGLYRGGLYRAGLYGGALYGAALYGDGVAGYGPYGATYIDSPGAITI